jgi:hypothetical protein
MLLPCVGLVASLAGVWTLAGLSETSPLRLTPRVLGSAGAGLAAEAVIVLGAPSGARSELLLALLFGTTSLLSLLVGAAKIEAALVDRNGPRVVRRAGGLVLGTFLGMAAVGAVSLEVSRSSLSHGRLAWSLMFALVTAALLVFVSRARYAGVGVLSLGARSLPVALLSVALLVGSGLAKGAPARGSAAGSLQAIPSVESPSVVDAPPTAPAPLPASPAVPLPLPEPSIVPVPSATASAPSATAPAPSASTPVAAADAGAGGLQVEAVTTRGMLEADARGGVARRRERLHACLSDPKNHQSGTITFKVNIDASGSVGFAKPTGGDLVGTPLAACLLPVFYNMGFAAPASNSAGFEITLRAPPQ